MAGLVTYPLQLRPDRWITLVLPSDLTRDDIEQLISRLQQLALLHDETKGRAS